MWFAPSVDGTVPIRAPAQAFVNAFAARIDQGLLRGAPSRRNRYVVTLARPDRLRFRATSWLSAFNVGLNDVDLDQTAELAEFAEPSRFCAFCVFCGDREIYPNA